MKRLSFSIILGLLLCIAPSVHAQVSIGVGEAPVAGALLQLKDKENISDGSANATKGLGMPRVALTDVNKLQPMYSYADATAANTPDAATKVAHTGLMVYNIDKCTLQGRGLYVWDGVQWTTIGLADTLEGLAAQLGTAQDEISTKAGSIGVAWHKDHEGNIFFSSSFGATAGRWMTTNLATKTYGSRTGGTVWTSPTLTNTYASNSATATPYKDAYWGYPGGTAGSTAESHAADDSKYKLQPGLGLLYNWPMATGNQTVLPIQGICPTGWHLPSDAEWTQLEEEINLRTKSYSSTENILTTIPSMYGPRGTHCYAMKLACSVAGFSTGGTSNTILQGGFAALMAGKALSGNISLFGQIGIFWDSTSAGSRSLNANTNRVDRANSSAADLFSVRCKKD